MTGKRPYQIETVVWKLVVTFVLSSLFSNPSMAESDTCVPNADIIKLRCGEKGDPKIDGDTSYADCIDDLVEKSCGNESIVKSADEECGELKTKWNEAKSEFDSACGTAGMSGNGMNCAQRVRACSVCTGLARGEKQYSELCKKLDEEDEIRGKKVTDTGNGVNGFNLYDVQSVGNLFGGSKEQIDRKDPAEMYNNCPAFAASDLEKREERFEKLRDKVYEYQDDLADKKTEQETLATTIAEKRAEAQRELRKIQTEYEARVQDLSRGASDKIEAIQSELNEISNQLSQIISAKTQAQNSYNDSISQLDLNCHQAALTKINGEREARLAKINARQYRAGSLNRLLNSSGISSRRKSQQRAKRYYNECRRDRSYREGKKIAKRTLDQTLQALDATQQALFRTQQLAMQKLGRLSPEHQQDLQLLQKSTQERFLETQARYEAEIAQLTAKQRGEMLKGNFVQQRMQLEESRLAQYQDVFAAANHYSQGNTITKDEYSGALSKAATLRGLAANIIGTCNCKDVCIEYNGVWPAIVDEDRAQVPNSTSVCRAAADVNDDMNTVSDRYCRGKQDRKAGETTGVTE